MEAAALMVIAVSPTLRAGKHANMGRALELIIEVRFKELMEGDTSLYCPRVVSSVNAVLDLISSDWEFRGPMRVVQCVPTVGNDGAARVQFTSMSGDLIHETGQEEASDMATLRMLISEKLGVLEHTVSLISANGRLLMDCDLM